MIAVNSYMGSDWSRQSTVDTDLPAPVVPRSVTSCVVPFAALWVPTRLDSAPPLSVSPLKRCPVKVVEAGSISGRYSLDAYRSHCRTGPAVQPGRTCIMRFFIWGGSFHMWGWLPFMSWKAPLSEAHFSINPSRPRSNTPTTYVTLYGNV